MTIAQFKEALATKFCRFHQNPVPLKNAEVENYDHDGGIEIEGFKEKQWVYAICPECGQQHSHRHLEIYP